MTHIEQMIQDMCPNGVEFKKLGEVTTIIRGERVTKSQLIENGQYPVVSGGVNPMGYIDKYNREENTITIAQYGSAGFVNYINEKFWANDVCYSVMKQILESLQNGKSGTSIVYGSAGTGKTIVAINLVYTLTNILLMNVDDDIDESDKWQKLIKEWKMYVRASGLPKIAFVVPMQS